MQHDRFARLFTYLSDLENSFLQWTGSQEISVAPSTPVATLDVGCRQRLPLKPDVPAQIVRKVVDMQLAGRLSCEKSLSKPLFQALGYGHKSSHRGHHLCLHALISVLFDEANVPPLAAQFQFNYAANA